MQCNNAVNVIIKLTVQDEVDGLLEIVVKMIK